MSSRERPVNAGDPRQVRVSVLGRFWRSPGPISMRNRGAVTRAGANASTKSLLGWMARTLFLAVQLDPARARVRSKAQSRPRREGVTMQKIISWAAFAAAVVVVAPPA